MNNAARHAPHARRTTKQVRHKNEEEPDELMLLATESYCHAEIYDRLTMRQYCEAFEILSPQIKRTTLQIVARSLASCPFAPRAVVMALALEPIAVSRSILLQSQVLGQLDMMRIVDVAGKRHALMLAERHDVGPSVIKRLRELGVDAIDLALDENPALAENVEKRDLEIDKPAEKTHKLENLVEHTEQVVEQTQPVESVSDILPITELEQQIVHELEAIPAAEAATDLLRAAARGGRLDESENRDASQKSFVKNREPVPDLAESLERIAAAKSRQGLATLMTKASGFSLDTAFQVLEDTSGDTLAVFLKTHDIDPAAASRIMMLTFPSIGLSTQNAMRAIRFYKALEVESCREAVAQWPSEEVQNSAHQPYLEESNGVRWATSDEEYQRRDVELEEARRRALG